MTTSSTVPTTQVAGPVAARVEPHLEDARDWMALPGGELEAPRPRVLCLACKDRLRQSVAKGVWPERTNTLCFGCYRTQLDRDRRIRAAADLNTASEARFQTTLPFEPVNRARLQQLKAERQMAREAERRRAQIQARHALQTIVAGLKARGVRLPGPAGRAAAATPAPAPSHLKLPDAWLPFVAGR